MNKNNNSKINTQVDIKHLFSLAHNAKFYELKKIKKETQNYYKLKIDCKNLPDIKFFAKQIAKFFTIKDPKIRAELVNLIGIGLQRYVLKSPENLKLFMAFALRAIEDENGNVRKNVVNNVWIIKGGLIAKNKKLFKVYKEYIIKLLARIELYYHKERKTEYPYLEKLPPSIFKSLNMLYFEFEPWGASGCFGLPEDAPKDNEYQPITYKDLEKFALENLLPPIFSKTKEEVIENFKKVMKKYKININLDDWLDTIYKIDPLEHQQKFLQYINEAFAKGTLQTQKQAQEITDAFASLWNYTPHKALGNATPADRVLTYKILEYAENLPEFEDDFFINLAKSF